MPAVRTWQRGAGLWPFAPSFLARASARSLAPACAVLLAVGFVVTCDGERAELAAGGTEREIRKAGGKAQQAYSLLQGRLDRGPEGGGGGHALAASNRPSGGACAGPRALR